VFLPLETKNNPNFPLVPYLSAIGVRPLFVDFTKEEKTGMCSI
jgi:hypothetical protein